MAAGEQLKYGFIRGFELSVAGYMTDAQTMRQASGRFVYLDSAGRCTLNADGAGRIWGHAEYLGDSEGSEDDRVNVNIAVDAAYRIPINSGTFVKAMIGDECDISISSNIQGAQLDASDEDTLMVVGGDLVNSNWVDVKIVGDLQGTGNGVA